ncbi:hypothetical protein FB45DRAFT_1023073 [Roridomyces roridus]|uniref:F-box domain-containing protein n=1 Tax=Roridomyces roridus TaxID=1738132 RepID=A0AAD7FTD6_9AGAR|nr:hypothetical protein FB45DRAFT_1023073 [Roridomyces roridus]
MESTPRIVLQSRLEEIRRKQQAIRAIVYPILSIPGELSIAIFKAYVKKDSKHDPLALSHVCRQWRQTALATPDLWTYISSVRQLPWRFDRTGTCLLHADVTIRSPGDLAALNKYLSDHPSRWEMLAVRMECTPLSETPSFALPCFLPLLQKLSVRGRARSLPHVPEGGLDLGSLPLATNAPYLVELKVSYIVQLQAAQMNFAHLTTLSIAGDESMCRQFLDFTPNLQCLTVCCLSLADGPVAPVVMGQLRTVILTEGCHLDFLDQLTVPVMEHLEFEVDTATGAKVVEPLMVRSACSASLRGLCLRLCDNNMHITEFFDSMGPHLANLEDLTLKYRTDIDMGNPINWLFARVSPSTHPVLYPPPPPPILVALKSLTLVNCGQITNRDIFSTVCMLEGRTSNMAGVAPLQSLRFTSDPESTQGDPDIANALSILRRLRHQGILRVDTNAVGLHQFTSIRELPSYISTRGTHRTSEGGAVKEGPDLANVEELALRGPLDNNIGALFNRMGHPRNQQGHYTILPALKSLTLVNVRYISMSTALSMAEMLEARTTSGQEIATLKLLRFSLQADSWNSLGQAAINNALHELKKYRERGILDIQVYLAGSKRFTNLWEFGEYLSGEGSS